jgi:hypothetical protein
LINRAGISVAGNSIKKLPTSIARTEKFLHTKQAAVQARDWPLSMPFSLRLADEFPSRVSKDGIRVSEICLANQSAIWASSETLLGLPFDVPPPYIPLDEEYPARPETAYLLSKLLGEEMAKQFCRWDPELKIVALRLLNVR